MSKERELLESCLDEFQYHEVPCPELVIKIKKFLAEPEEEGVYQKLLRIEDGNEVEILPSELWQDRYETGKRAMQKREQEPLTNEQKSPEAALEQALRDSIDTEKLMKILKDGGIFIEVGEQK